MPHFIPDEMNIEVDDYYYEMSKREKQEMYELLIADGYGTDDSDELPSVSSLEFNEIIEKISSNRLRLTSDEDEMLSKIASRL